MRHVVQRDVKAAVLLLELLGRSLALGNVLVGADLIAVLQRLIADRDQAAIGETAHKCRLPCLLLLYPALEILKHILRTLVRERVHPVILAETNKVEDWRAGLHGP